MSLYDKYHSLHNKKYMYNLIANLIKEDYSNDVVEDQSYNQFFETNFINTFNEVETEELQDLNKHLLDTQINYFNDFIVSKISSVNKEEDDVNGNTIIYSLTRIINFNNSNRHSYRVSNHVKNKSCQLEKIIIPIEDDYLFSNPIIIISFDSNSIELHLRGTMKLGHREYGIYTPFYETTFKLINDKSHIILNNQVSTSRKGCDVYKIDNYSDNKITLSSEGSKSLETGFLVNDYIRIYNFKGITLEDSYCLQGQYKVTGIEDNKLVIDTKDSIKEGLYVMNLSIQHSIHLTYN